MISSLYLKNYKTIIYYNLCKKSKLKFILVLRIEPLNSINKNSYHNYCVALLELFSKNY